MMGSVTVTASCPPLPREVHVWRVPLDPREEGLRRLARTLSDDERARAEQRVLGRDGDRFIAARGALRCVLGGILGEDPAKLRFAYGALGKPSLAGADQAWLQFSISHSGERALISVARDTEVGIDLEEIREDVNVDALARVLDPADARALPRGGVARTHAFFTAWARREAYLKALGCGLLGSRSISDPLRNGYRIVDLPVEDGYRAALAVAAPMPPRRIVHCDLDSTLQRGGEAL
jgi:4'-phosphopantetheinyl transferase